MWAALIGAAASLASSAIGGIKAKNAAKKAEGVLASERQKNNDYFGRYYNQDYTQTAEAQNLLNRTSEEAQKYISQAAGRARVGGGSAEEVAAAIEKAGEAQANTAGNIAAQATQAKENVLNQYNQREAAIDNAYNGLYNQQAANNTSAANAGMQAGMGLVTADMQSKMKTGKGLFGNMFKANGTSTANS